MCKHFLIAICCGLLASRAFAEPNLVVVFTDDQVHNAIGYDNPEIRTPHLDALAKQGIIFEKAYIASPICDASRASMMTGLFPQQHGLIANGAKPFKERYWTGRAKATHTLAHLLSQAGYHTAAWGKSRLGKPTSFGFHEGAETGPFNDVQTFERVKQFVTERAASDKPFFLWLAPNQAHVPLKPEQKWLNLYDSEKLTLPKNFRVSPAKASINNQGRPGQHFYRDSNYRKNVDRLSAGPPRNPKVMRRFLKAYYATISHLDHQVGAFVEQLNAAALWENTVLVFLSDNGYHLGSHGLGNKITMHEESVRVPMFVTGPGIARGKRSKSLVSSLDVYPTLLALAGVTIPDGAMGKSLVPVFQNPETTIRRIVFSECVGVGGKPGEGHRMAFDGRHKLVLTGTNELYLFDHKNDPSEMTNVIDDASHAEIRNHLESKMATWMRSIGDRAFPTGR